MRRARFVLEGQVQKVGLRYLVVDEARARGITGYVENLEDGTVEIVCEGAKDDIDSFIEAVKNLKKPAVVENVRSEYSEAEDKFMFFDIKNQVFDEDRIKGLSGDEKSMAMLKELMREQRNGFSAAVKVLKDIRGTQDKMSDKQDAMLGKQDEAIVELRDISAKTDKMLGKQDEAIVELRDISAKTDKMLGKQDEAIVELRDISAKTDKMLGKQDEAVSEIRTLRPDMNAMLDSRFQKLESEIVKIKRKLEI